MPFQLDEMFAKCSFHGSLESITTPKYFDEGVYSMGVMNKISGYNGI